MRVAIIHGGASSEGEVSTRNVFHAERVLAALGHEPDLIYYDRNMLQRLAGTRRVQLFVSKELFERAGIPTPPWQSLSLADFKAENFDFPSFGYDDPVLIEKFICVRFVAAGLLRRNGFWRKYGHV
jgi:D-alanine-D-alanine ligase-like ATP-grasp enzyme